VTTFNYTIVAVGVVIVAVSNWWAVSAKNWFTGPGHNIDEAEPSGRLDLRSAQGGTDQIEPTSASEG
jgi:hypothetical protein